MPYCSCTRPMAHSTTEHPMMKVSNKLGKNLPSKYVCGLYSTPKKSLHVWIKDEQGRGIAKMSGEFPSIYIFTCIHKCHVCSDLGSFPTWELGQEQKVLAPINPHLHCRQQIHGQFPVHKSFYSQLVERLLPLYVVYAKRFWLWHWEECLIKWTLSIVEMTCKSNMSKI